MPRLTVIQGGVGTGCSRPSWQCEEQRIELTVSRAERVTFTAQVAHHSRLAEFALVKERIADCEYHLMQLARLAAREDARARAMLDDGPETPAVAARRAA